jgi:ATP-dependent exoDNAse (exonuclease V) beta subunit
MDIDVFYQRQKAIKFDEETHSYLINGKKFDSVTTYIKGKFPAFVDKEKAREKVEIVVEKHDEIINEDECNKEELKKRFRKHYIEKWKDDTKRGRDIHKSIENFLRGDVDYEYPEVIEQVKAFMQIRNLVPFKTECVLYDEDMQIAGTADAIFRVKGTDNYVLVDWKTSRHVNFPEWYFRCGQPPFDDVQDCKFTRFSLQLLFYEYMLEKSYGITITASVVFIPDTGGNKWHVYDINRYDMEKIVKFRIKELTHHDSRTDS